jgi:polysaccharide chain length determinant protein (PEP-CTERM system associated)
MLPGQKFTPEEILGVLRRRVWLLLVPFAIVAAATAVIARKLPDSYKSDSLLLVVPQRVPEDYVKSTVTTRIEDRLQAITQQILSRTRLERIIQDFDLYADERRTGIMEDVVEKMRKDIEIQIVKGDAFRISYVGYEPRTVMKVTERLASAFIEEGLRDRETLAEGTSQFLETQLADARRRLVEDEKKVEAYRRKYAGELPSQLDSNLQAIRNTQMQVQSVLESLNRDQDRRLMLERQIAELENQAPEPAAAEATAEQQLATAKTALAALETRLTDEHPDVQRMKRVVRDLQAKADAEAQTKPVSAGAAMPATEAPRQKRLRELHAELDQLTLQIAHKQDEEKQLRAMTTAYQTRVEKAPTRESELTELTRDYGTLQTLYSNLLAKKEESQISANLERRQIGEQFRLLDPARLPEKPFRPNRPLINSLGLVGGLIAGCGLIALVEYRDKTFKTDEDVTSILTLPVLAVVPFMQSGRERRRRMVRRVAVGFGLATTVVACLAVVVYTFVR